MKFILLILILFFSANSFCQYAPGVGVAGTTAIYKDSSLIVNWAKSCKLIRGKTDINNDTSQFAYYGNEIDALGIADNIAISLGDSGVAVLKFDPPIKNGNGVDFAVFENSFDGNFLELAYVEVSSDSVHWYRFNSVSLTQTDSQITTFGILDPTKINNLAGKYKALYGTPFDLQELQASQFLNIDSISFVKIIDVIGAINGNNISFDSYGNKINDPYPTPFYTCGFDLDAVAVINQKSQFVETSEMPDIKIFPNPFNCYLNISYNNIYNICIYNEIGEKIIDKNLINNVNINTEKWNKGVYFVKIFFNNTIISKPIIKL